MASSAPLAAASARPLNTRLTRKTTKTIDGSAVGTKLIIPISIIIVNVAKTSSLFLPTISAKAPDGISARTMVAAHTAFKMENWATLRPKSRKRIVNTG